MPDLFRMMDVPPDGTAAEAYNTACLAAFREAARRLACHRMGDACWAADAAAFVAKIGEIALTPMGERSGDDHRPMALRTAIIDEMDTWHETKVRVCPWREELHAALPVDNPFARDERFRFNLALECEWSRARVVDIIGRQGPAALSLGSALHGCFEDTSLLVRVSAVRALTALQFDPAATISAFVHADSSFAQAYQHKAISVELHDQARVAVAEGIGVMSQAISEHMRRDPAFLPWDAHIADARARLTAQTGCRSPEIRRAAQQALSHLERLTEKVYARQRPLMEFLHCKVGEGDWFDRFQVAANILWLMGRQLPRMLAPQR